MDEMDLIELTKYMLKSFGYSLEYTDQRITGVPDLENNEFLPDIYIDAGKELVINFSSELPVFSLADFSAFNEEMANAERAAKVIKNLYNNTLALRLENINL